MSGSFASEQTVEGNAEADDQQHTCRNREKPLPFDGFSELSLDTVMSKLNCAVAGLDRYALLDLVGASVFGAIEVWPTYLARVEQHHVEPRLIPFRRIAVEAGRQHFRIAAEAERHRQGDVMPATAGRVAMDSKGKFVDVLVDHDLVVH